MTMGAPDDEDLRPFLYALPRQIQSSEEGHPPQPRNSSALPQEKRTVLTSSMLNDRCDETCNV